MFLYTITAYNAITRQTFVKQYRANSPEEIRTILDNSSEYYHASIMNVKVSNAY